MILAPLLTYSDAMVVAWLPGREGAGITDILFGDAKPSGKLPDTWPRSMAQIPINDGNATYDPLYTYGYGLSYCPASGGGSGMRTAFSPHTDAGGSGAPKAAGK